METPAGIGRIHNLQRIGWPQGIAPSYMTRVMRLTLPAPDIVEAIPDGKQEPEVTPGRLLEGFPAEWGEQHD